MEQGKLNLSSAVKVDSVLTVVSGKPTEAGKIHEFSALDLAMAHHTIHLVFYYESSPFHVGPTSHVSWDLNDLRDSLSQTLNEFPVATGRLSRGPDGASWRVKCNDAGVRMLRASVDATMDEWLRSAAWEERELTAWEERELTAWEDMPLDPTVWSPFRIQINNFKCGGLAIGLSCSHMHADITSATLLMKSWAQVHQAQPLTHPPIFHLPQKLQSPATTTPETTPSHENIIITDHSWSTLKFPASAIQKALSRVRHHCPDATPFDILTSLLWSRIIESSTDRGLNRSIRICVDSRGHGFAPAGYFGNAFCFSELNVGEDELLMLEKACDRVHRHVEGLKKGGEGPGSKMYGPGLTCVDIEASMYGAEFEKGVRPAHVSCRVGNIIVEGEGLIMVMPSDEGGMGRTVTIALPRERIDRLCKDRIVQEMEPIMLINGRS